MPDSRSGLVPPQPETKTDRRVEIQLGLLLSVAILCGGGGVAYAINNLIVQLAALAVLAMNRREFLRFWRGAPLPLQALTALTLAFPLLQLIPLPPAIWERLPGRNLVIDAIIAAGAVPGWRSLSVDPARTFVAFLGLLAPLAILTVGWALPRSRLARLGWLLAALGLVNFLWGIPQVVSNGASAIPYPENPMPGVMFGSFANRNSTGLFLVACLALVLWLKPALSRERLIVVRIGGAILFASAVLLTQSRSAIVLAALVLGVTALRTLLGQPGNKQAIRRSGLIAAGTLALAAIAVSLSPGTRIETAIDRFTLENDTRHLVWQDAAYSAQRYWPVGAGMGTFDEVFQIDESLENLTTRTAGRAHNDYLELAIEGGAFTLLLVLGWMLLVGRQAWRCRSGSASETVFAGTAILAVIALQSVTDYPLRNAALLSVAAFALLMVMRAPEAGHEAA